MFLATTLTLLAEAMPLTPIEGLIEFAGADAACGLAAKTPRFSFTFFTAKIPQSIAVAAQITASRCTQLSLTDN